MMLLGRRPPEAISSTRPGDVGSSSDPGGNRPWQPAHFFDRVQYHRYRESASAPDRRFDRRFRTVGQAQAPSRGPFGAELVAPGQNLLVTARKVILSLVSRRRLDNVRTKFQSRS